MNDKKIANQHLPYAQDIRRIYRQLITDAVRRKLRDRVQAAALDGGQLDQEIDDALAKNDDASLLPISEQIASVACTADDHTGYSRRRKEKAQSLPVKNETPSYNLGDYTDSPLPPTN